MAENESWLSHGFKRAPSFFAAQTALGWGVVLALLAVLGVAALVQGSQAIESGYRMQNKMADLRKLQEQNTILEAQIAQAQSVDDLQEKAEKIGFVETDPEEIEYLVIEGYPLAAKTLDDTNIVTDSKMGDRKTLDWLEGFASSFRGWRQAIYAPGESQSGGNFQ